MSFQRIHVSTVPNRRSPFSAASRAPLTLSRIHFILVALKYASSLRPVLADIISPKPLISSSSQSWDVRLHCQTIALKTGFPVCLFQTTVVSRWFVIPIAMTSSGFTPPEVIAFVIALSCFS